MAQHASTLSGAVSVNARGLPRPAAQTWSVRVLGRWLVAHREGLWIALLLVVAGVAHGLNMYHFPYYENDEGTYMSQAWAVLHMDSLAPYTYTYDHAPVGWLQISIWTVFTGGMHAFGSTIDSGRVFMLVLQVGSTFLLYGIARKISGSITVATMACLMFILSAYGGYFHRRILLDNITTFWMLLSMLLLVTQVMTLKRVWLSALALGISILSKELTIFLVPVMAYLVFSRSHRSIRGFATIGWLTIVGSIVSLYVMLATLKGELFATGTFLGGKADHVSLIGTLQYQASRGKDAGLLSFSSAFWQMTRLWIRDEPLLVVGGSICAIISLLMIRRHMTIGVMGAITLSLWAFLGRGGEIIEFYLVPLLPLLALNIALVFGVAVDTVSRRLRNVSIGWSLFGRGVKLIAAGLCSSLILLGYVSPDRGFAGNHLLLWTSTQADAQNQAIAWVESHVPANRTIIMDNYMWTDLHDGYHGDRLFKESHYYWKLDRDKAIGGKVFHHQWQNADYVLSTIQLTSDINRGGLTLTGEVLRHSVTIARFDTGGWPVEVREVIKPGQSAPHATAPVARLYQFLGTTSAITRALLRLQNFTVNKASAALTFTFPDGTTNTRVVDVDASSTRTVSISDIQPHSGSFKLRLTCNLPIAAGLKISRIPVVTSPNGAVAFVFAR